MLKQSVILDGQILPISDPSEVMITEKIESTERADTVELGVKINGREYFTYMVPGSCNLRSFYGLNNISKGAHPRDIIAAVIMTGISGGIIVFTDAYASGDDAARLGAFIHDNKLGVATICPASVNPYTGRGVVTLVFGFEPAKLLAWYNTQPWAIANFNSGWFSKTDQHHMDSVFYQYGGRPQPKKSSKVVFKVKE